MKKEKKKENKALLKALKNASSRGIFDSVILSA